MDTKPFFLHALSPLHPGAEQSVDLVDLPIARMKATGIPIVPGSSIKGVLRDAMQPLSSLPSALSRDEWTAIFGPETRNASEHAGALVVSEARLLALPVRSFRGTFAWVTSPLLLTLARRDLAGRPGLPTGIPNLNERRAITSQETVNIHDGRLYIEDLDLPTSPDGVATEWAAYLARHVWFGQDAMQLMFKRRFVIADDETMTFLWETATQIDARVRVDPETRTVADKALWYEESLPPETLLIGLLAATRSMHKTLRLSEQEVLTKALPSEQVLQFGGKATVGRGRCRVLPVRAEG